MSKGAPSIKFNLDDDDEIVDPADLEDSAVVDDPRADDPFKDEDEGEPAEDDLEVDVEDDDPDDDPDPPAAAAAQPAPDDELAQLRARLAQLEQERERDRKEHENAQKSLHEARTKKVDDDLAATRTALKVAIEEGDTEKQLELIEKVSDLKLEKSKLGDAPKPREAAAADPDMPHVVAQNDAARKWVAGKAWINNATHAQANRDLVEIATAMAKVERIDPNSDAYYGELERRMRTLHPTLFPAAKAKPKPQRKPAAQHVGRVTHDVPAKSAASQGKRKVVLTAEDQRNMIRFGLDPSDREVQLEYARNKEVGSGVA